MARKVLTNAEMVNVINSGGSVLITCKTKTILATSVSQLPTDDQILACFPLVPLPVFDEDDLNANAIGILGYFFSGTPANGDSIKFNSSTNVWEFAPLGASGIIPVTEGGTGLSSIPNNTILYASSINTFAATNVGNSLAVNLNTLNVVNDTSTQKVEVAGNNNLFGTRKRINFLNGANTTISITDDPTNNKVDVTVSASASAGSRWDTLANPSADLTLNHGSAVTTFIWGNATAGNSLFRLKDSNNNSGNGYLLDLNTGTSSTINPLRITVSGTSNGVLMDSNGKLAVVGSGNIEASSLKGASSNGIAVRTSGSTFVSRSIVSSGADISVTNGDGVSGNPTVALGSSVVTGVSNDTNVQGSITNNLLTLSWAGSLSKARQNGATVYNDQANTYVAGNKQNFIPNSTNAAINVGSNTSDPSALSNGDFWGNSTDGKIKFFQQGTAYDLLQLIRGTKTLTDAVATSIFEVDLTPLTACSMIVNYSVYASDGTNIQVRSGSMRFSAFNKAGTIVTESYISSEGIAPSIGTLSLNWSLVPSTNKVVVKANADTSLTANTFYLWYSIDNMSNQTITKL